VRKSGSHVVLAVAIFALPWIALSGQRPGKAVGRAGIVRLPHPAEVAIATPMVPHPGPRGAGEDGLSGPAHFAPSGDPFALRQLGRPEQLRPEIQASLRGPPADRIRVATPVSTAPIVPRRAGVITPVPEPATFPAVMGSLAVFAFARRWRRRSARA